jgi:catechol 2,3-dioxygenase-like lactoylglutathione lyase family enzyme
MLHHVEIYVSNLGASRAFWSEILSKLGYKLAAHWEEGFTLSDGEDANLTFVQVKDRYASHKYLRNGVGLNHLAFKVRGRSFVDLLRQ